MNSNNNYYTFKELSIKHAFFIKPFDFNSNIIDANELEEQYSKVKEILNINNVTQVKQEHTSIIKKVTLNNLNDFDVADGMITNVEGIGLATKVADCQAIFLFDPVKRVIGNIHSGWKGTIKKIVKNGLDIMINDYECDINNIKVYINPSIGKCHFEVDYDVYEQFKNNFYEFDVDEYVEYKEFINKYYIDTEKLNKRYLEYLGIKETNIILASICTVCNGEDIHSYRYDKDNSGRNLAIISL